MSIPSEVSLIFDDYHIDSLYPFVDSVPIDYVPRLCPKDPIDIRLHN